MLLFYKYSSLENLPDISIWNLNNVKNIRGFFFRYSSLLSLMQKEKQILKEKINDREKEIERHKINSKNKLSIYEDQLKEVREEKNILINELNE